MTTITLDLPAEIYQRAERLANSTKQTVEQIVIEWIQPTPDIGDLFPQDLFTELEKLDELELTQMAKAKTAAKEAQRLQKLLALQGEHNLTKAEQKEAQRLVEQEDLLTLRKACALFILKQRGLVNPAGIQHLLAN